MARRWRGRRRWPGGAASRSRPRVCDLEDPGVEIPAAAYQVVTCFRFLHRPLLPKLAAAVAPAA